ncbi:MAG TPA: DUF5996 family protein [Vicinamibacterales bacterium]
MARSDLPPLPLSEWAGTYATLHMWTQVVGKIRLALAPPVNHWWHVTFLTTARGLTTTSMPYQQGTLEIVFDFIDHRLLFETSDGRRRTIVLEPKSVADFYREVMQTLGELDISVRIWPMPVEVPAPIRFDRDVEHHSYDRAAVERWWQALLYIDAIFKEFRGLFLGKSSPAHFFWGGFDLAVTRFNGRRAPERPGADAMTREAYSHEVTSAGFWPGGGLPGGAVMREAVLYAYAAPEPPGYKTAHVGPRTAFYSADFNEFFLKYEDLRIAPSPHDALMEFLQSTYEAGATLGGWNRGELERK